MFNAPRAAKPKLGVLGLMTDGYETFFPGIIERQENFVRQVCCHLKDTIDFTFLGAGLNRNSIESIVKQYNAMDLDGILIIMLTYSQGSWIIRALQDNNLPIAMVVIQQAEEVGDDWEELDLTVNQGLHGAQDNANAIVRLDIPCGFFAGRWQDEKFTKFAVDFGRTCMTMKFLRSMRVAVIGRMTGMNDILTDEMAFFKKIGPEFVHETLGPIYANMEKITKAEIDKRIKLDHSIFNIDEKLSYESHAYAIRFYLGIKRFLEEGDFDAFTIHFDNVTYDGRFKQLPLLAASHLMADGYGYAAEGDAMCACMVSAAHRLGNMDANFTEMYTMDFNKQAIIFCHAGEGNWATCREDMKPALIDRFLGEGGLENPPTPIFTPKVGATTLTSLAALNGDDFRLVICNGEVLPKSDLKRCEMPYFFWRPYCGIETCIEKWMANGGTHHEVINVGDVADRWKMLAKHLCIDCVEL